MRHGAVAELKARIDKARREHARKAPLTLDEEALSWRSRIEHERDPAKREALLADLAIRAVEGPESARKSEYLYLAGTGKQTPVAAHVEDWLAEAVYTKRTQW